MRVKILVTALAAGAFAFVPACSVAEPGGTDSSAGVERVAEIASDRLVRGGNLTACMDMPYQPFQYFDEAGEPIGVDIDLMTEVAARLGLKPNFQNAVFDTIVAAVKGGKCDLIWADQYVTPERVQQLDMMAYWKAAEVVVVPEGNPKHIGTKDKLCGFKVAGQKGGADVAALEKLSTACTDKGEPPINVLQFPRSPDAYQALASGQVDAWMTEEVAALLLKKEGKAKVEFTDNFALGDGALAGLTAFSFRPDDPAIKDPVMKAVQSMIDDGTWHKIWEKWGLADIAVGPKSV
ncbi:ABC transporter substrate-binding protein [Mycolicibacterium septicum]|uniref:ABC transporter substrate-binding protein n=1 Tax=Mycolicibacterium septicum TaxID=98668 RepID=UPI0023E19F30|nr:ABC transporter substrate-binding protein [Mycolicibacterium septicum]MDF3341012.1 ABC transporter substrate-binding protein [Mycolicibacterium septicum]